MSNSPAPSLLQYARFHGIASDITLTDPFDFLDQMVDVSLEIPTLPEDKYKAFDEYLFTTQQSLEKAICEEKLNVRKDGFRLLSNVIKDVKSQTSEYNYEQHLQEFRQIDQLRLEPPIFSLDYEISSTSLRRQSSYGIEDVELLPVEELEEFCSETIPQRAEKIEAAMGHKKLNCDKQSLIFIQDAIRLGNPSSDYLNSQIAMIPRKTYKIQTDLGNLAPMDMDDALYRSSPQPEFQMLLSPASIELSASSKQRFPLLKSPDIDLSSQTHGCRTRNIPILEPEYVVQIEQDNAISKQWNRSNDQGPGTVTDQDICISISYSDIEAPTTCFEMGTELLSHFDKRLSEEPNDHLSRVTESPSTVDTVRKWSAGNSAEGVVADTSLLSNQNPPHLITRNSVHSNEEDKENLGCGAKSDLYFIQNSEEGISMNENTACSQESCGQNTLKENISPLRPFSQNQRSENGSSLNISASDYDNSCSTDKLYIAGEQLPPQKKRKCRDTKRNEARNNMNEQNSCLGTQQQQPAPPSSSLLGSLATFMELRGHRGKRLVSTQSPYFHVNRAAENRSSRSQHTDSEMTPAIHADELDNMGMVPIKPEYQKLTGEQPILFLSTTLLKTHLRLVRCLEGMAEPPAVIYREYNQNAASNMPEDRLKVSSMSNNLTCQDEADIIISPSTGIVLTTSQATTQLYLPGHKFDSHPQLSSIGYINSPLRERIFLLTPRYERIYIFICHGTSSSRKSQAKQPGSTADQRVLASVTSLTAFCNSLSAYSTIFPILLPSAPETVAEWILSLATKHIIRLPVSNVDPSHSTSFTPINAAQKRKLSPKAMERTTAWELFLRQAGFNPFAAQTVLAVLRQEDEQGNLHRRCADSRNDACDPVENVCGKGLSRFIEMAPMQRKEIFDELIGGRLLTRVNDVLDKDWQCDWALNFDVDSEL